MEKDIKHSNIGDMLLKEKLITEEQLNTAVQKQKGEDKSLSRILVDLGYITEGVKMSFLRKMFGYQIVSLKDIKIDPIMMGVIPRNLAHKHLLIPIKFDKDSSLVVAMEDPSDIILLDNLKQTIGRKIKPVIASIAEIEESLNMYPSEKGDETEVRERSLIYRMIRYSAFPILCFLPLAVFMALLFFSGNFQTLIQKYTKFDFFLFFFLGWGLWAIILYEINGLIFFSDTEEDKKVVKNIDEY